MDKILAREDIGLLPFDRKDTGPLLLRFATVQRCVPDSNALFRVFGFYYLRNLLSRLGKAGYQHYKNRVLHSIESHSLYYIGNTGQQRFDRLLDEGQLMAQFNRLLFQLQIKVIENKQTSFQTVLTQWMRNQWNQIVLIGLFRSIALTAGCKCYPNKSFLEELAKYQEQPNSQAVLMLADYLQINLSLFNQHKEYRVQGSLFSLNILYLPKFVCVLHEPQVEYQPQKIKTIPKFFKKPPTKFISPYEKQLQHIPFSLKRELQIGHSPARGQTFGIQKKKIPISFKKCF